MKDTKKKKLKKNLWKELLKRKWDEVNNSRIPGREPTSHFKTIA